MSVTCVLPDVSPQKSEPSELDLWLNGLDLCRPKKRIHRDFSDGYLFAMIIKRHYPNLIDTHNYISTSKHAAKINNWRLLKSKILKKLNIRLTEKMIEDISSCVPGVVDNVLLDLKHKIQSDFEMKKDEDAISSDSSWYDVEVIDEHSDIMIVPIRRKVGEDKFEVHKKKMVAYECYEALMNEISEKVEAIDILKKKANHFEELLKSKDNHIEELQRSISRKALRSKKNEISLMDTKPENLDSVLELNYVSKLTSDESLSAPKNSQMSGDLINLENSI